MIRLLFLLLLPCLLTACRDRAHETHISHTPSPVRIPVKVGSAVVRKMLDSAMEQTRYTRSYDPAYRPIAYPNGDVPRNTGVCADVIVRAFRSAGTDLQREIHEDMTRHFAEYPRQWGLSRPDPNIDHRRVPNLMRFFARAGKSLPVTGNPDDYQPGDVVAWRLGNGLTHVGIVSDTRAGPGERLMMIHNIGRGARLENVLFAFPIIGHYRWFI